MADLVSFDGPNKLIIVNDGENALNFDADIYSPWKRWVAEGNDGYLQAIRVVGGDPTISGNYLGSTFFLMNGWMIKPYEANHELTITGNFYGEGGYNPLQATIGNYNVLVTRSVTNIIDLISINTGSGLTTEQALELTRILNNTNLIKAISL